jgi:hypothetical protein
MLIMTCAESSRIFDSIATVTRINDTNKHMTDD